MAQRRLKLDLKACVGKPTLSPDAVLRAVESLRVRSPTKRLAHSSYSLLTGLLLPAKVSAYCNREPIHANHPLIAVPGRLQPARRRSGIDRLRNHRGAICTFGYWAKRAQIDPARVRSSSITLSHDGGRWLSLGLPGDLPAVVREVNGQWQRLP